VRVGLTALRAVLHNPRVLPNKKGGRTTKLRKLREQELGSTVPILKNSRDSYVEEVPLTLKPTPVNLKRVIQLALYSWVMVSLGPTALANNRPNIIFILADDLGYGHLGSYGQKKIRTPHLDRMASEGVRFTQVYAGNTVCAPSRCVLMTGHHGGHSSVRANSGAVPLLGDDVTVASVLKRAGYVTGIFGKWGLGDARTTGIPNQQGFDEFYGYLHQVHAHFYYPHFLWKDDRKVFLTGNREDWRKQYSHDLIAEAALDFVRRYKNKPFFLYLPFTIPHSEHLVPRDSLEEYQGKFPEIPFTSEPRNPLCASANSQGRDGGHDHSNGPQCWFCTSSLERVGHR